MPDGWGHARWAIRAVIAIVVAALSCASPAWSRGDAETTIVLLDGSGSMIRHAVDDG